MYRATKRIFAKTRKTWRRTARIAMRISATSTRTSATCPKTAPTATPISGTSITISAISPRTARIAMPTSATSTRTSATSPEMTPSMAPTAPKPRRTAKTSTKIGKTSTRTRRICTRTARICGRIAGTSNSPLEIKMGRSRNSRGPFSFLLSFSSALAFSDANRAFEHFHRRAAYTRNEFFARLRHLHFNMARPAHLRSLKDAQRVAWREFPMSHEIGPQRTCRRTRRGIFIKLPGKHSARTHFAVGVQREAISHRGIFALQLPQVDHAHRDFAERRATAQRHHQVENARGNKFRFEFRIEIFRRKSKRGRKFLLVKFRGFKERFLLRHRDAVRPAILEANLHGQNPR